MQWRVVQECEHSLRMDGLIYVLNLDMHGTQWIMQDYQKIVYSGKDTPYLFYQKMYKIAQL